MRRSVWVRCARPFIMNGRASAVGRAWHYRPSRDRCEHFPVRCGRAIPGAHAPANADSAKPARIRRAVHDERPTPHRETFLSSAMRRRERAAAETLQPTILRRRVRLRASLRLLRQPPSRTGAGVSAVSSSCLSCRSVRARDGAHAASRDGFTAVRQDRHDEGAASPQCSIPFAKDAVDEVRP